MSGLLSKAEVVERLGISFPTLWTWMRRGEFPRPVELSASIVRWRADEVEAWLASRPRRKYKAATPPKRDRRRRILGEGD